jgi:amidase
MIAPGERRHGTANVPAPMDPRDLAFAGLERQAQLVRSGEVSSRELVEVCLDRIAALDPQLNAFRTVYGERAALEADQAQARLQGGDERPLLGVPIAIKDNTDVAGDVTTHGTSAHGGPAGADAEVVRRARAAGAIVIGKTNVPPLCALPVTESAAFGTTRNPWSLSHTPGGSSGGSAAAVAAGLVPAALGSDGGGSIRFPSAFNSLFGLKPQRDRVPLGPLPEHWHGMSTVGWIARSVRDTALLYDLTSDGLAAPLLDAASAPPGPLRIAYSTKIPPGFLAKVDERVRGALMSTVELLRSLGHTLAEDDPDHTFEGYVAANTRVMRGVADEAATLPHRERLDRRFRRITAVARRIPDAQLDRARAAEAGIAARANAIFERHDVLITPVAPEPPFEITRFEGLGAIRTLEASGRAIPFTVPWNQTGQPAAAVPAGFTADGLPLAVQLVGRPGDEATLVALAAQLESERPWADRRPPVS